MKKVIYKQIEGSINSTINKQKMVSKIQWKRYITELIVLNFRQKTV
jgi:hypothetical protein